MATESVKFGFITFLDILGYKSFLDNNEPEDAANSALDILLNVQDSMSKRFIGLATDDDEKKAAKTITDELEWVVFSDSIVFAYAYPENADEAMKCHCALVSLFTSMQIQTHLLENGLPVRGALSFGKYLIKKTCFAGRPIIEAYEDASRLQIAAIEVTDSAIKELDDIHVRTHYSGFDVLDKYPLPLNDGTVKKTYIVPPAECNEGKPVPDIRQYVASSFWKHRKDITPKEHSKLLNTELFYRWCHIRYPGSIK